MPNISATATTLSPFPSGIDSFPLREDGQSIRSITSASALNRIEAALYQAQIHTQKIVHSASGNRKRVIVTSTFAVGAPAAGATVVVSLSASQKSWLGAPVNLGSVVLADVFRVDAADCCYTQVAPVVSGTGEISSFAIQVFRLDGSNLTAGTYQVRLTILGA